MKRVPLVVFACVASALLGSGESRADPPNAVLEIYNEAVVVAELEVAKQEVQTEYDTQRRDRIDELWAVGAAPDAWVTDAHLKVELDEANMQILAARLAQARAYLAMATANANAGKVVSLCP